MRFSRFFLRCFAVVWVFNERPLRYTLDRFWIIERFFRFGIIGRSLFSWII